MKKAGLVSLLLLATIVAVTSYASAEKELDIPRSTADYGEIAAFNVEDFCVITTKTVGEETNVTLSKEVDSIQAGWMGYGEQADEIAIEDLSAIIELKDHRYQLGATWTNAYWTPYSWEDDHDEYFTYDASMDEINQKINAVREYMSSGEYQKTPEAQKVLSFAKDVREEVVVEMPKYCIYTLEELERIDVFEGEDGEVITEKYSYLEHNDLEVFEYGTDMETIQAAYEMWCDTYPDLRIYMDPTDGHAWGRLIGRDYYGSSGAPNYAYITIQGQYKVVYGRNGRIQYFEKSVPVADLFGVGIGKATFVYKANNAGWYIAKVKMEFSDGEYQSVTASYDGNGRLYGVGVKNAE